MNKEMVKDLLKRLQIKNWISDYGKGFFIVQVSTHYVYFCNNEIVDRETFYQELPKIHKVKNF